MDDSDEMVAKLEKRMKYIFKKYCYKIDRKHFEETIVLVMDTLSSK